MHVFFFIFSIYFLSLSHTNAKGSKLLFAQILYRHGDRAPIELYPNDPNPESFWTEGLGKLTILGRKQHYALGKFLRQMYKNFTTSSSPNEINVISSEVDRCMKSAETNLASFFAPGNSKWEFDKHLNWQPIPVFYIPKDDDKFLETDSYCPRAFAEQINVENSPEGRAFLKKHKEMFKNLTINSGSLITNWTSASYLHDVLFIEKKYNLSIPSWVEPYWDELQNVADLSFFWSFNSPLLHRLRAGPLLKKIIKMMESKLAGEIPLQKFQIYSAHDTNVAVILDALNLYNMKQPPYCATLLFELHELTGGEKAVRLLYLNSTEPERVEQIPHVLVLEGCTEFCPLSYFIDFTKDMLPNDWREECQIDDVSFIKSFSSITDYEKGIVIGICFAVLFIVILMSVYAVWKVFSKDRDRYSSYHHLVPLN